MAQDVIPPGRARRHLQRWGGVWLAGVALLGLSQMLWVWQSWPVRHLLDLATTALGRP